MCFRICIWLIPLFAVLNCSNARADLLRKTRPNPAEQVPALIKTLSSDLDERHRAEAAAELHNYDSKTFPDIIPALIEALKNDASTPVRREAANSIGKMRPISQIGGYALEQAEMYDPAIGVRAIALAHLKVWVLFHGYKKGRPPEMIQTEEPPLADPVPMPKLGPTVIPPEPKITPKKESSRSAPPLLGTGTAPKGDRLFPKIMKRVKPDFAKAKTTDDGPLLNGPR